MTLLRLWVGQLSMYIVSITNKKLRSTFRFENLALTMSKILMSIPKKVAKKMIPGSVWICGSSHIVCVFHILREVRAHLKDVGL